MKILCKPESAVQGECCQELFLQKAFQIQVTLPSCPILASLSIVGVGAPHPLLELLKSGLSLPPQNGDSSGLACVSPTDWRLPLEWGLPKVDLCFCLQNEGRTRAEGCWWAISPTEASHPLERIASVTPQAERALLRLFLVLQDRHNWHLGLQATHNAQKTQFSTDFVQTKTNKNARWNLGGPALPYTPHPQPRDLSSLGLLLNCLL